MTNWPCLHFRLNECTGSIRVGPYGKDMGRNYMISYGGEILAFIQ